MSALLRWGTSGGLVRSGRSLVEFGFMHPCRYRDPSLVHRIDNAETVARIGRETGGIWLPLNHAQLASPGRSYSERGNVMADVSPTPVHAFANGPKGKLSRRAQLVSFAAHEFTPSAQSGNDSGFPVSWTPARPVHVSRPITQTTMWLAIHLLTAFNFGGLTAAERALVERGYTSYPPDAPLPAAGLIPNSVEL